MVPQIVLADIIVTRDKTRYSGKVIKILKNDFAVKLDDGTVIILKKSSVKEIIRNNMVLDLDDQMRYMVEKKRPFLPFLILSAATGIYAGRKFKDYSDHKKEADAIAADAGMGGEYQNLSDQSKRDMAIGIVSAMFSVGSFYIAVKPVEMRTPMGRINFGATSRGVSLALRF